ncbi:MAG: hypothetical protein A2X94_13800 [Bdellovibrionales bacterium GWB1_55_8]|nr:MAG: hypothetical protein A2X94_13800 [Bdellovibrionales bacterium GWB1_55_8]
MQIDLDHPEEAEIRLRQLLEESSGGGSLDAQAGILAQLARVQGALGKFSEARGTLQKLDELAREESQTAKILALIETGRLFVLEKTPSQARPLFMEAWNLAGQSGDVSCAIDAAQMLAAIEPQKLQKDWTLKALRLAENSPEPIAKNWLGEIYTTLGWSEFNARQFESALEWFKKALARIQPESSPRRAIIAQWAVGKTLRALNRFDEAFEIQSHLVEELSRLSLKNGYVYEELAECLQSLKKTAEAQPYFDIAYHELAKDEWLSDNNPARLKRLKDLGKSK